MGFALVLFGVQIWQGTSVLFAICSLLFIVVATFAFNLAGGFSRTSGAYIFFYSLLGVIVGLCCKAILGERADSNLLVPELTIKVFLGGITAMLGAVFISRKLTARRPLLRNLVTDANMQNATVGCLVTGLVLSAILTLADKGSGTVLSALAQINRFLPMAMILGVVHEIRKSGGTRSVNIPVLLAGAAIFGTGLIGFSKEGMFTPVACWMVAAGSQRYKLSLFQIAGGFGAVALMFLFLVPYSQYGRNAVAKDLTFSARLASISDLLSNLGEVRQEYNANEEEGYSDSRQYFNKPQGLFDRLQMISVDDMLVEVTERKGTFGYLPVIAGFENLIPRAFWPNKPSIGFGNLFAHEIGGLPEDDTTTGISFSPSGEAYHLGRWVGVFLVAPALWIMLFTLFDSLCGDTRVTPWGLLLTAYFAHAAPEGMLDSIIYTLGFGTLGLLFAAFSAAYMMPIVGTLVKGPEKRLLLRTPLVRSIPRSAPAGGPSRDITH